MAMLICTWHAPMFDVMLKFLNTFSIKSINMYFGHKDMVYVIIKQLIIDVFGMCENGMQKNLKGQINKSLAIQVLQSCRLALANSYAYQWNTKSLGLPYSVRYPAITSVIYQREKVQYSNNTNVITLMRAKKGQEVDWAQIIFNNMCSELDQWYTYVKENKGDKKNTCTSTLILVNIFQYMFVHQKENPQKPPTKVKRFR